MIRLTSNERSSRVVSVRLSEVDISVDDGDGVRGPLRWRLRLSEGIREVSVRFFIF